MAGRWSSTVLTAPLQSITGQCTCTLPFPCDFSRVRVSSQGTVGSSRPCVMKQELQGSRGPVSTLLGAALRLSGRWQGCSTGVVCVERSALSLPPAGRRLLELGSQGHRQLSSAAAIGVPRGQGDWAWPSWLF